MANKMKAFVRVSQGSCVLLLVTVLIVSGFAIYQLQSKERQIPVPVIEDWRFELIGLLILCAYAGLFSIIWFFVAGNYKKDDKLIAAFIVITFVAAFCAGLYLSIDDYNRRQQNPVSTGAVFNATKTEILKAKKDGKGDMWAPDWLETIQEESKSCCGIINFKDYDDFWEPIQDNVPKSCCRSTGDKTNCHTYLQNIPYPDTVAKNIKVDTGCYLEINQKIHKILCHAFIMTCVVTFFIALSAVAFTVEYFYAYFIMNPAVDVVETSDPVFQSEEQIWQTLDLFPSRTNNNNPGSTDAVASGEMVELANKDTNTDFPIPDTSPNEPLMNQGYSFQTASQQTMPPDEVRFIPEISTPLEYESQTAIMMNDQNQDEFREEFYPENRKKERHRHRRRHRDD